MENITDIMNTLRKNLLDNNITEAVAYVKANKDNPDLQEGISEIMSFIVSYVNDDILMKNPVLFDNSLLLLNTISEELNPEDVLLQIVQHIKQTKDDTTFINILDLSQKVLLRLPTKRLNSLSWMLNAISSYLREISLPNNYDLEDGEEILMDADSLVDRISALYMVILPLYKSLVEHLKTQDENKERAVVLLKFTLQLLGKPLAFLDLNHNEKCKSRNRRVAEALVGLIIQIKRDIFWILQLKDEESSYDIGYVDNLALATFYYLVLSEQVLIDFIPKVYDHIYIFQNSLHLATELFKHQNHFVIRNGLSLARVLLNYVEGYTLSYELLDLEHHSHFCKELTKIIIYNHLEKHRQEGLQIFQRYLFLFDTKGRYLLIYNLMNILDNSGIVGYITTQYKDMLMQEFDKNPTLLPVYFSGSKLLVLLNKFCYLPEAEESDLLKLADQTVATLNLLRYLIIRDKRNVTKIWDYVTGLEQNYLKHLRKALTLSRAHYELDIKNLKSEDEAKKNDINTSVSVSGERMIDLSREEKLVMLQSSLTTFDVLESLLCRLNELIEIGHNRL